MTGPAEALVLAAVCALGGAAVLWLLRAAFRAPKAFAGVVAVSTVISQTAQTVTGSSAVGYMDELCVLLAVVLFTLRRLRDHGSVRCFAALWLFLAFGLLGVLSGLVHSVPLGITVTGAFLFLKGPMLAFALAQLDWRREDIPGLIRGGAVAVVVILLFTAANAAAPAAWNDFISAGTVELSERGGIASLSGPFNHPVGLGTTMSLAFIAILAYRSTIRRSRISLALLIGSGLACLLAFRRKSIASALVVSLGIRASLPGKKAMYLTSLAILTPVALILGWDTLTRVVDATLTEYLSDVSQTARIRLTLDSIPLALGAFPLGVGFGRFASFTAAENYSPYYQELGYTRIWGMTGHDEVDFLSDTFWPAPLAETGVLGLLCYICGLVMLGLPAWRMMRRSQDPHLCWIGSVGVGWLATMAIESVAAPVFVAPPMYGLPFLLSGVVLALTAEPTTAAASVGAPEPVTATGLASASGPGSASEPVSASGAAIAPWASAAVTVPWAQGGLEPVGPQPGRPDGSDPPESDPGRRA